MKNITNSTPPPSFSASYPQRISRIVFVSTFALAIAYACFLVGQYIYWFTVNPQNREFGNVFSFIVQLIFQTLLALSSFLAIKQKNTVSLAFAIIPLIAYSILLFAPGTIIKGGFDASLTLTDRCLRAISFCSVILLFAFTIATITIIIIRFTKNKKSQPNT